MVSSDPLSAGFLVVANPGSRALELYQEALARQGLPSATLVPWRDLIEGRTRLQDRARPGMTVRMESPGRDFLTEQVLLATGAEQPDELDPEGRCFDRISAAGVRQLSFDRGRIFGSRQWFLGFRRVLARLDLQLSRCPPHRVMNCAAELLVMFDKPRCRAVLAERGLPVPFALGRIRSFAELREAMLAAGLRQVFVKLAHGSSASGTVAYRTDGTRHRAYTTVERVEVHGEVRLYNTRRIRVLDTEREIAAVVEALCRHHVHVEEWVPKAGIDGHTFDLRVLTIAGRARHTVVRKSRTPITNLHLLNPRGEVEPVRARMSEAAWAEAMRTCEAVAGCFPESLHAGIDLAILSGYQRHAVLEVNGFGDLLPGVLHQGVDTYTAEIEAIREQALRHGEPERERCVS